MQITFGGTKTLESDHVLFGKAFTLREYPPRHIAS